MQNVPDTKILSAQVIFQSRVYTKLSTRVNQAYVSKPGFLKDILFHRGGLNKSDISYEHWYPWSFLLSVFVVKSEYF